MCSFLAGSGLLPSSQPSCFDDRHLTSGMTILFEVSRHIASERACHDLAAHILERSPGGGPGFISRHTSSCARIDWLLMSNAVLNEWCQSYPKEATSGRLHNVLRYKIGAQDAAACLAKHFRRSSVASVSPTKREIRVQSLLEIVKRRLREASNVGAPFIRQCLQP